MSKFNDFLNEQLQDPEVRAEYEALEPEFSIMQAMIDARKQRDDPEATVRKDRYCTGRHQQTGERQCQPVLADAPAPRCGNGDADQN